MPEKKTLTDAYIKRIKPPVSGRKEYFDKLLPGFGLRVTDKGNKSYVVFYRVGGKQRRVTLGSIYELTLAEARDQARNHKISAKGGVDLVAAQEAEKRETERVELGTFRAVADIYIEDYCKPNTRTWKETERMFKKYILPKFGKTPVDEISRAQVRNLIKHVVNNNGPVMANRVAGVIRSMYSWMAREEDYEGDNPARGIAAPNYTENKRDRYLDHDEIKSLLLACDKMGWPFGPYFKFLLLTGQRKNETVRLKRSDIKGDTWTIPKEIAKNGERHLVPLTGPAIELLESSPQLGEYIFTTTGDKPLAGFSKAKRRCEKLIAEQRKKDDLPPMERWTIHDLRRTAASGMAEMRIPPRVVEKILNHTGGVISGVAAIYNRHGYDEEKREALTAWSNKIGAIMNPDEPMNVTSIKEAREARNG